MYTANSSFPYKIVNGSVGLVKDIVYAQGDAPPDAVPIAVIVEFESYCGPPLFKFIDPENNVICVPGSEKWVLVIPITADCDFGKPGELSRAQLPLKLTWGYTGWKGQGSTF